MAKGSSGMWMGQRHGLMVVKQGMCTYRYIESISGGSAPVSRASAGPTLFACHLRECLPSEEAQGKGTAAKAGVRAS